MDQTEIQRLMNLPLTGAGNAERLQALLAENWKYVPQIKRWLQWNGRFWQEDEEAAVYVAAVTAFRQLSAARYKSSWAIASLAAQKRKSSSSLTALAATAKALSLKPSRQLWEISSQSSPSTRYWPVRFTQTGKALPRNWPNWPENATCFPANATNAAGWTRPK
ncbi:MAG: hypothetical protein IKZ43_02995 [Acidaminococcaceae bacterium]|nr:hypothetical protein [Acidaminococcaceae bacterium]